MKQLFLTALGILLAVAALGQTTPEELQADWNRLGGLYYAYPGPQSVQTPAPKGYKPFYISHFGRHGSRWLIDPKGFDNLNDILQEARGKGILTELGQSVCDRVAATREDHLYRHGDLSPLGYRQHQEISTRMYRNFPEVFRGEGHVTAKSTRVSRVMTSMFAFCSTLKGFNPRLRLEVDASRRGTDPVSEITPEARAYRDSKEFWDLIGQWRAAHVDPSRLLHSIFTDEAYIASLDGIYFFATLADMAFIQQNVGNVVDLYDVFTFDELFAAYQYYNLEYYIGKGSWPGKADIMVSGALPILKDIIEKADIAVGGGDLAATLRFSHDSYLVPTATILQLDGCRGVEKDLDLAYMSFAVHKVSPMAGNIQMVFYRSKHGPVLVKFLLNENEVGIPVATDSYPYYKWDDVRDYYVKCYNL